MTAAIESAALEYLNRGWSVIPTARGTSALQSAGWSSSSAATEGVAEGERNNTVASLAGRLLWYGVDPEVVLELLRCWNRVRCRRPLGDEEVVQAVHGITRLHEGRH